MDNPFQNLGTEIAALKPDGTIEVLQHEPEDVARLIRAMFMLSEENTKIGRLLDETLQDSERIEWLIKTGKIKSRLEIDVELNA